jgi:hypothetical protein
MRTESVHEKGMRSDPEKNPRVQNSMKIHVANLVRIAVNIWFIAPSIYWHIYYSFVPSFPVTMAFRSFHMSVRSICLVVLP